MVSEAGRVGDFREGEQVHGGLVVERSVGPSACEEQFAQFGRGGLLCGHRFRRPAGRTGTLSRS